MKWNKSEEVAPPIDGKAYLGLVKGNPCIWQYNDGIDWQDKNKPVDENQKGFWFCCLPADYEKSQKWNDEERFLYKLTHWAKIELPEDYGIL